ncbi:class I SAM-dependent methyltransferase [bacterium]|nr:class I SAM-dependent methyltransferase [bacterium]
MTTDRPWHDQDRFWELRAKFMFAGERWERTPQEIDAVLALLDLPEATDILDLCCGPGRHSLELARRGCRVTGVDRTVPYLNEARERAAAEGLAIEFVQQDMREFRREDSFDIALSMFTSFGYFEDPADDRRVIENLCASLRPGGKLLIEMMGKEVLAARLASNLPVKRWQEAEGILFLTDSVIERDWSWIHNREVYLVGDERVEFDVDHRLYSAVELKTLLTDCGCGEVVCYGTLAGTPYDQSATRLIAIGTKPL